MSDPHPDGGAAESGTQRTGDAVTVVADLREPTRLRMLSLDHPDVEQWTEAELSAADFVVNGIGFERKTPSDFASSMVEKRLDEQVEKLKEAYDDAYILLEGGFHDFEDLEHTRLKPQSARGKAASITARHGIPVIPCGSRHSEEAVETTERTLIDEAVRLGRKHTEAPTSAHLPTGSLGSDEPSAMRMWACLPGVGPTMAERLYAEFGSPADYWALYHGSEDPAFMLTEVKGIGEKTAANITEALTEP